MEALRVPLGVFFAAMAWTLFACVAHVRAGGLALKAHGTGDSPETLDGTSARGVESAPLGRAPRSCNRKLGRGLGWWLEFQRVVRRVA
jgi:hypothetical protein